MAKLLVYRCPQNGLMTQTWLADVGGERQSYEPVYCLACSQQHFINVATGRALGDNAGSATTTHGPAFPPKAIGKVDSGVASPEAGIVPPLAPSHGGGHVKTH